MKKSHLLSAAAVCVVATGLVSFLIAQTSQPSVKIPANGDNNGAAAIAAIKASPRHGEFVNIDIPGSQVKLKTWVVYPERPDKAPILIVIHEIFGLSDWVRAVADQAAADGFIAVAPDLVSGFGPNGGGTESAPNGDARGIIGQVNADEQIKRLDLVREYALKIPGTNGKVGAVGYCWGGAASFNYAAHQPKLNAAAVYYGRPPSRDLMSKIECPIVGFYGQNDTQVSPTVEPTKVAMAELKKDYIATVYDGAGHGFLRQHTGAGGIGEANLKASQQAWPATVAFFKKNLQ